MTVLTKELFEIKLKEFRDDLLEDLKDADMRHFLGFYTGEELMGEREDASEDYIGLDPDAFYFVADFFHDSPAIPAAQLNPGDKGLQEIIRRNWADLFSTHDPFFADDQEIDFIDDDLKEELTLFFQKDTVDLYSHSMAYLLDAYAFDLVYGNILSVFQSEPVRSKSEDAPAPPIKAEDLPEFVGEIIDIFEDFLTDRHIILDNPEREEDPDIDPEKMAIIYGSDYSELQESLEALLLNWNVIERQPVKGEKRHE